MIKYDFYYIAKHLGNMYFLYFTSATWNIGFQTTPKPDEKLFLYLIVFTYTISVTLVRDDVEVQRLVHYLSKAFKGIEARYPNVKKLALAQIVPPRKLRAYFLAHIIIILTDQPLKKKS